MAAVDPQTGADAAAATESVDDVMARVGRIAEQNISIVATPFAVRLCAEIKRLRSDRAHLAQRNAELHAAVTVAAELIDRLAFDDDACEIDHNGYCQTHHLHSEPCPYPLGRRFVEAWGAVQAEGAETTATRPADGPDGTGEGQRTGTGAREAQRGSQGDGAAEAPQAPASPTSGNCPWCGTTQRIDDGFVVAHRRFSGHICPGSGRRASRSPAEPTP